MLDALESEVETIDRHLGVLAIVAEEEPIGISRLADRTGYPDHKVRYSLRTLEEEELVEPTDHGAVTTESVPAAIDGYEESIGELIDTLEDLDEAI